MPPKITGRYLNEHECECGWVFPRFFVPTFLPNLLICKSWGVVVVVGSCGGTDSGTPPPSCPVFPISLKVVNECCMKTSGQHFAGSGPISPSWELLELLRAETTTTQSTLTTQSMLTSQSTLTTQSMLTTRSCMCLEKNTDPAIVGYRWTGAGGHHALDC